jgi:hypothetical protein
MNVYELDKPEDSQAKYVLFSDKDYLYIVREEHAEAMKEAKGQNRMYMADIAIDRLNRGLVKSRFF